MATKKRVKKLQKGANAVNEGAPAIVSREIQPSSGDLTITISGPAEHVRRALEHMRFERPAAAREGSDGLSVTEGREIALAQTLTPSAKMIDTLGAPPINFVSPGLLAAYKDRCLDAAEKAGHPISDESKIPNKAETKVNEVGDALSQFSV